MVNIMVEMERNYITAEYFRTIQVSCLPTGLPGKGAHALARRSAWGRRVHRRPACAARQTHAPCAPLALWRPRDRSLHSNPPLPPLCAAPPRPYRWARCPTARLCTRWMAAR